MNRSTLLLLCICGIFSAGKVSCKNTVVTGQVLDQVNNPLSSAIVSLMKAKDTSLVKATFTDANGNFSFSDSYEGIFILEIAMPGHKTIIHKFSLEEGEEKKMDVLEMETLKKGEHNENFPLLAMDGDKLLLDMEGSGKYVKGSAWEIMKTAPNVSENEDGFLTYKNKGNVEIEIDGKKSDLSRQGLKNKIKLIPASTVAGLEIYKENSTSTSKVVINIVTLEGEKQGFYGTVNAGIGYGKTPKTADGFEFNYKKGNFDFYGNYNFSENQSQDKTSYSESFLYDGTRIDFQQQNSTLQKPIDHAALAGVEYKGKKGFSFGAEVNAENILDHGTEQDISNYNFVEFDTTISFEQSYTSLNKDKINGLTFHVDKTFRSVGTKFSFEYTLNTDYNTWNETFPIEENVEGTTNQTVTNFYRYAGGTDLNLSSEKFKYTQVWTDNLITVAGVKKSVSTNSSFFGIQKLKDENWMNEEGLNESFQSKRILNSAFLITYLEFGKFEIAAAVEAQQAISNGISQSEIMLQQKSGIQIMPSLSIDQTLNANNKISYSFSQDIKRPSFRDLDPTSHYVNRYTYEVGNPNLRPQITNNAEIKYSFLSFFSLSAGMDFTENGIQRVSRFDSTGTVYNTKENITKSNNKTLDAMCAIPIGNRIVFQNEIMWTFSKYQTEIYGMNINNNSHSFSALSKLAIEMPRNMEICINGLYISPSSNGYISRAASGTLNMSISKALLNKQLNIEIAANDILNTGSTSATILTQDGPIAFHSTAETQNVSVNVKYSFGNEKAVRK